MPEQYWLFCDYVDHRGTNVVLDGLSRLSAGDKAKMNEFIRGLERREEIDLTDLKPLRNINGEKGKGLHELRYKAAGVQQRPICIKNGPKGNWIEREFGLPTITIFVMAKEMNGRFVPSGAVQSCWNRIGDFQNGRGKIVPHSFL